MSSVDDRKRKRALSSLRDQPRRQSPAPQEVTVIAVGHETSPQPLLTHLEPSLDSVQFVRLGRHLVVAGTFEELRGWVADLGIAIAEMEHEVITEEVAEGNRRVRKRARQLA